MSSLVSEGPELESLFHQVDVESLWKTLYMLLLTALRCQMNIRLYIDTNLCQYLYSIRALIYVSTSTLLGLESMSVPLLC